MSNDFDAEMLDQDRALAILANERGQLINLAYRLLGTLADAEDAVQEATARWYAMTPADRSAIVSPGAWLSTVVSRICLDVLGSARKRREQYVGEWIPEPVPDPAEGSEGRGVGGIDPSDRITLDESVDMAFLVVLDRMTPAERVTFLLHDIFRYPFDEVAEIVGRSSGACRQLASSARRRVRDAQPAPQTSTNRTRVVREFRRAWQAKDVAALVRILDPSATAVADGGGLVAAELQPIEGGARIAQYLVDLANQVGSLNLLERSVNGRTGLVATDDGVAVGVYAFEVIGDRIHKLWVVRNPNKLRLWAKV
jgi:RNA polymerase sigma-70 factor (ECF subfamily)